MRRKRKRIRVGDWVRGYTNNKKYYFFGYVTFMENSGRCARVKMTQVWEVNNHERRERNLKTSLPNIVFLENCEIFEFNTNIEDIRWMIDFALEINDKRMFNKYSNLYIEMMEIQGKDGYMKE